MLPTGIVWWGRRASLGGWVSVNVASLLSKTDYSSERVIIMIPNPREVCTDGYEYEWGIICTKVVSIFPFRNTMKCRPSRGYQLTVVESSAIWTDCSHCAETCGNETLETAATLTWDIDLSTGHFSLRLHFTIKTSYRTIVTNTVVVCYCISYALKCIVN